jgi:hypothetical protein
MYGMTALGKCSVARSCGCCAVTQTLLPLHQSNTSDSQARVKQCLMATATVLCLLSIQTARDEVPCQETPSIRPRPPPIESHIVTLVANG